MQEINWRAWGDAAFEEARHSGKPVLLSISAVWCHWCHVMDHTTYATRTVVDIINDRFIPVRVDSDRNPDINVRYNMGGWPTVAFLTHERDVLTGATYVPPEQMASLLVRMSSAYVEQRDDLVDRARDNRSQMQRMTSGRTGSGVAAPAVDQTDAERVLGSVRTAYDRRHGGFGADQKFPHTSALELLLLSYEQSGRQDDLETVVNTLEAMLAGDIFDKVEGGMFRYTTRSDWSVPHYEKMLEDNANIAVVLLEACRLTGREEFLDTARRVFLYLETALLDAQTHAFRGSQDADEEYYLRGDEGRKQLVPPKVDNAFYTDSNAAAVRAYLKRYAVTGESAARDRALRLTGFLNGLPRDEDDTVCHYVENGAPHLFGVLRDQVSLLLANALCFEASGMQVHLSAARQLSEAALAAVAAGTGGLYDVSERHARERGLSRLGTPLTDNALAAIGLLKLADLGADSRIPAERILNAVREQYPSYGIIAAEFGIAVVLLRTDRVLVTVEAEPWTEQADSFISSALGACGLSCTVKTVAPDDRREPGATICVGTSCLARVTEPSVLAAEVRRAVAAQHVRQP